MKNISLILIVLLSINLSNANSTNVKNQKTKKIISQTKTKKYQNSILGLSFDYPISWLQNGTDIYTINISGDTTTIQINFTDTIKNTTFSVIHYLAPRGVEIYNYAVSQFKLRDDLSSAEMFEIIVANKKAIKSKMVVTQDGKGNQLNNPYTSIIITFLDKKKTGSFSFQFQTQNSNYILEKIKFDKLLNSINIIK